jgi:DNA-binding response OmpR family regulator
MPQRGGWRSIRVDALPLLLLVEDDEDIQSMLEDALTEAGFKVATRSSGEDAIALLKDELSKYRALITDANLSGQLSGWDVAKAAREIDPAFPVVYTTSAPEEWGSRGVPNSILVTKPFAPTQVVTAVSNLLNTAGPLAGPA